MLPAAGLAQPTTGDMRDAIYDNRDVRIALQEAVASAEPQNADSLRFRMHVAQFATVQSFGCTAVQSAFTCEFQWRSRSTDGKLIEDVRRKGIFRKEGDWWRLELIANK